MKDKLKQFWNDPVNRFWLICGFGTLFALCFGIYSFFEKSLNPIVSLSLISIALFFEVLFLIALMINTLADTKREYLEAFQEINRDLRYGHYQKKNKDKDYKGPEWNDEEFSKITDLKERVDAFVKASIEYQQVDFKRWKKRNVGTNLDTRDETLVRSFLIILAGAFSVSILAYLGWFNYLSASKLAALNDTSRSFFTIPAALIGTLVASPVIFMLWLFRDKNNRIQIENARKDTNLKDFQKLSEWASGFHLPEIKQTTGTKTTNKTTQGVQENTEETTTSQEDFLAPEGSNSISRRQGAEALQASAIAQLEAFMFGKYGEQFMQPAFLLIHAIWESIISQQKIRYPDEQDFEKFLKELHKNPIVSALNKALAGASGYHLKLFENNLQGINLIGLDITLPSIQELNLTGYDLNGINLSYANLINCNFSGANFASSNLYKTDFANALLIKANLVYSNFDECSFYGAYLQGANLTYTNVTNNIKWNYAQINRETLFGTLHFMPQMWNKINAIREYVLLNGAIWDDDPNWLVDKIQDKKLLEKIFKDCEERRKYQN